MPTVKSDIQWFSGWLSLFSNKNCLSFKNAYSNWHVREFSSAKKWQPTWKPLYLWNFHVLPIQDTNESRLNGINLWPTVIRTEEHRGLWNQLVTNCNQDWLWLYGISLWATVIRTEEHCGFMLLSCSKVPKTTVQGAGQSICSLAHMHKY